MSKYITSTRALVIMCMFLTGVFLATIVSLNSVARTRAALYAPTLLETQVMMARVGLTPEHLAAAGVSPSAAARAADKVLEAMILAPGQIGVSDQAVADVRGPQSRLQKVLRSGLATEEEKIASSNAQVQLDLALAQRKALLAEIRDNATAHLSDAQRSILRTLQSNESWSMPLEFLTTNRPEADWVGLRNALANERISAKLGEAPDDDAQALLAAARAHPTVRRAFASIVANTDAIAIACEAAIRN